jgi:hypothetical protein
VVRLVLRVVLRPLVLRVVLRPPVLRPVVLRPVLRPLGVRPLVLRPPALRLLVRVAVELLRVLVRAPVRLPLALLRMGVERVERVVPAEPDVPPSGEAGVVISGSLDVAPPSDGIPVVSPASPPTPADSPVIQSSSVRDWSSFSKLDTKPPPPIYDYCACVVAEATFAKHKHRIMRECACGDVSSAQRRRARAAVLRLVRALPRQARRRVPGRRPPHAPAARARQLARAAVRQRR